jgi:hypothetical protein
MSKSNKNSGAQNRKRKAKQEKETAIQKDSLLKFIKTKKESGEENDGTTSQTTMQESIPSVYNEDSIVTDIHDGNGNGITNSEDHADVEMKSETMLPPNETALTGEYNSFHEEPVQIGVSFTDENENQPFINFDDPALWPTNSDSNRIILITKGPVRVKQNLFPETMNRRFNAKHYVRTLENGEKSPRSWLVYSTSTNAAFCFCCKLFYQSQFSLHWQLVVVVIGKTCPKFYLHMKNHHITWIHICNGKKWKHA